MGECAEIEAEPSSNTDHLSDSLVWWCSTFFLSSRPDWQCLISPQAGSGQRTWFSDQDGHRRTLPSDAEQGRVQPGPDPSKRGDGA